jgi:hypothetical protein
MNQGRVVQHRHRFQRVTAAWNPGGKSLCGSSGFGRARCGSAYLHVAQQTALLHDALNLNTHL